MAVRLAEADFRTFTRPLIGMELTHIWRGYGSAIFLNFGDLHHEVWNNGRISNNPNGEMSVAVTEGWHVEGQRRIWCGSWSDEAGWDRIFQKLVGAMVKDVSTFCRLPEIDLELSCGVHVVSFMTATSDPDWSIHDERDARHDWIQVKAGRLWIGTSMLEQKRVRAQDVCILQIRAREE